MQSKTWKLRHTVGPDAEPTLQYRASMSDEQWVDMQSVESDQEWLAMVKRDLGVDVDPLIVGLYLALRSNLRSRQLSYRRGFGRPLIRAPNQEGSLSANRMIIEARVRRGLGVSRCTAPGAGTITVRAENSVPTAASP